MIENICQKCGEELECMDTTDQGNIIIKVLMCPICETTYTAEYYLDDMYEE